MRPSEERKGKARQKPREQQDLREGQRESGLQKSLGD